MCVLKAAKMRSSCLKSLHEQSLCKQTNKQASNDESGLVLGALPQTLLNSFMYTFFFFHSEK